MHATEDLVVEQALQLSFQEKLRVLARLAAAVSAESLTNETTAPHPERVPNLHPGAFEMADDFDEPLPDEFWLGKDNA